MNVRRKHKILIIGSRIKLTHILCILRKPQYGSAIRYVFLSHQYTSDLIQIKSCYRVKTQKGKSFGCRIHVVLIIVLIRFRIDKVIMSPLIRDHVGDTDGIPIVCKSLKHNFLRDSRFRNIDQGIIPYNRRDLVILTADPDASWILTGAIQFLAFKVGIPLGAGKEDILSLPVPCKILSDIRFPLMVPDVCLICF